jgi:hypothetical protein
MAVAFEQMIRLARQRYGQTVRPGRQHCGVDIAYKRRGRVAARPCRRRRLAKQMRMIFRLN